MVNTSPVYPPLLSKLELSQKKKNSTYFEFQFRFSPTMASEDAGCVNSLVSIICKDRLQHHYIKDKCQTFLTEVKVPSGWQDRGYRLDQRCPSYKYRLEIIKNFIDKKKTEGFSITNKDTFEQFFTELEQFSAGRFPESAHDLRRKPQVDFFEQNLQKVQGVVLWKSSRNLKASILIKTEDYSKQRGNANGEFPLFDELVVNLQDEGELQEGDGVEVTKCVRREGEAWEPEVIKCYYLSETKIESFLSCCLQRDGSTAAVTEIARCRAAWNYTLELSKERYSTDMTLQILEIIDKICSTAQMSYTVSEIVKGFQQSEFFKKVLPDFIKKITEISTISLLQKILKHVISVKPSSGLQVLPMATILARKLVDSDSGQAAVDFFAIMSTIIATNMPGAREDLKVVPWNKLPLIPDVEEIIKPVNYERLKTDVLLPVIKEEGMYQSEEEYLDTYFRLLREECFYKLRKGINDFVTNGMKCDSKDMVMYRISLRGACTHHEDSATDMLVSLEYEVLGTQANSECEHANTCKLMRGNLLCISINGSFEEPVWVVVERHIAEQRIINVTLCDKANTISEPQFIVKMQEITNKREKAFMAESQTFYVSYAPAMEVLQQRDFVPFKEFLVYPDPSRMEPAEYISKIKAPPDWGIIFQKDSLLECSGQDESSEVYSLLDNFDKLRLKCRAILDDTQLKAVELALRNKVVLIQGPPGTGKSFVGVALVRLLLSMNVPQDYGPILVVTYKNHALDNFLKDCLSKVSSPEVKIVRVGSLPEDADEDLKKCLLTKVASRCWPEKLLKQKRKLMGQIWALQRKVNEAFEKLRSSCFFNAEMFMQEASDDQLKFILVDNKKQNVTETVVEELIKQQPKSQPRLKELVEKALKDWLPPQELFDLFGGEKKESSRENSLVESGQEKGTDEQDQSENPNDFKDPSVEKRERLLAIDEEIADEEEEEIAKTTSSQCTSSLQPSKSAMRHLLAMDEAEVRLFVDVLGTRKLWKLNQSKRVQLVYVLQSNFYSKASVDFLEVSKVYSQLHHQLKELKNHHDIEVMKRRHIIGMTVTGATMRANLLADVKPSVMIVEEAAEILEGQLVAVIPPSVQHLIMIGDHKQLRPLVHFHRLKKHNHLDLSMFERLVNCKLPFTQLEQQCRMRDEFANLLRELKIYDELKTNYELVKGNQPPSCATSSMYFWTHTEPESESKASHSKRNTYEAEEITRVAQIFCQDGGISPSRITVLCSYRGQVDEIKDRFRKTKVAALYDITVTTIDSFQGQENDIILISLVRSNQLTQGKIGYLSSMNRLCVAISRARCGLYLFGNHVHLAGASRKGWKVVSDFMRKKRCLGTRFPFCLSDNSKPQSDGNSPTREAESPRNVTYHLDIHANQASVNIGGDNSVNTVNTNEGSWKTPVHDPKSPSPKYVPPTVGILSTQEAGPSTKEAREPIQEAGEHDKEEDSPVQEAGSPTKEAREPIQEDGEHDKEDDSPVQEAGSPTKEAREPIPEACEHDKEEDSSAQEVESQTKEANQPIQELGKPKSEAESPTKEAREAVLEVDKPTEEMESLTKEASEPIQEVAKPNGEAETPTEDIRKSVQEVGKPNVEAEVRNKEARESIQETAKPTKEAGSPTKETTEPVQEVDKLSMQSESPTKEARESVQEVGKLSMEAEEGRTLIPEVGSPNQGARGATQYAEPPTQEVRVSSTGTGSTIHEAVSPDEETREAIQEASTSMKETGLPAQDMPDAETFIGPVEVETRAELPGVKALKETDGPEVGNECTKEDTLSTQETMAAGKGPFEETGPDEGKSRQETGIQSELQAVDRDKTKEVMEDKEVLQGEVSQGKPEEETESMKVENEISKEEALPTQEDTLSTQETMAAGKGPFEETGPDEGKSRQETGIQSELQAVDRDKTKEVMEDKEVLQGEVSQGKPEEETESMKVENEISKEEALPTQETMAAGKGPFEETGLEVGVKGQATDEQE